MADQQTDLAIVVEAINKASDTLKQVEKDLGNLSKTVGATGDSSKVASMGMGQLITGVAAGSFVANLAYDAFRKLFDIVVQLPGAFFDIAKTASEVEGMAVAMHVVANNAGITAEQVDKVRDSVREQNVTTEAANRLLTDLIRNQLDYKQATDLATAAQNIAVASGVSSSETIERISQSIASGNTWLLRQLGLVEHLDGVYKKYAVTINKTSEELTESERKQAVVNYVLQEGEKYAGAYSSAMMNAAKVMRSTDDRLKEISYNFGKIFEPALYQAAKAVYDFVSGVVKWAREHEGQLKHIGLAIGDFMKGVVNTIQNFIRSIPWDKVINGLNYVIQQVLQFGAGLRIVANVVQMFVRLLDAGISTAVEFGRAVQSILKGDFQSLSKGFKDYRSHIDDVSTGIIGDVYDISDAVTDSYNNQKFTLQDWWKNFQGVEGSGWKDILSIQEEALDEMTSKQKDALKKMLRDIEKENRDYAQAVAKRTKDFQESFDDLIIEHRDKIKEMTADLEAENKDYKKKLSDLVKDYNEAMDEIEARHKEKTESIKTDMEEERKKAEEEIEKITEKYNEETGLIEREGNDRLGTLRAQLDKEKALGVNADQKKIESLEEMIAYEEKGLSESLDGKKAVYDEEVKDVNDALDEKLEKLKKSLTDEDTSYTASFEKRKLQYKEDVDEAKASYEEKRVELQKSLDEELAIQKKYADDFTRLANSIADDDITRLIKKFIDEKVELESEHQEKLADIKYQAFEGGEEFGNSFASGFDSSYPEVKTRLDQMKSDINETVKVADKLISKSSQLGDFGSGFWSGYSGGGGGGGGGMLWGAKGGIFSKPTMIGEAGAEVVLPLNFPKRMAQILQSMGIGNQGGGQVSQTFYVTVQNPADIDVIMERAGFAMRNGGGFK